MTMLDFLLNAIKFLLEEWIFHKYFRYFVLMAVLALMVFFVLLMKGYG